MTSTPIFNKDMQYPNGYRTSQDQLKRKENCKSNKDNNETMDKVRVEKSENEVKNEVKNSDENRLFKYVHGAETLYFKFLTSKRVECPICKRDFKNIISHLR